MLGRTGIGTYVEGLLRSLPQALEGDRLVVFVQPGKRRAAEELLPPGPPVEIRSAAAEIYRLREQLELPLRFKRARLDLLHVPHYNLPIVTRLPAVVTIHDLIPLAFPSIHSSIFPRTWNRVLIRGAVRRARRIIVPSQHTAQDLTRRLAVDPRRIVTVPEAALGPIAGMHVDAGWLGRLGIRPPYLLYLGQWKPYKNLSTLIAAFEKISAERGDLHLVIGGRDDPRYPAPSEAAARSQGRILVTGWIPSAALPALYQAAAAFVMPSLYEGFGLPVLEAMAWGTPVVCARATSLPEVAGDAAQYWEPATGAGGLAQAIKAALQPARADDLRRRGVEQASRFSWEETARRTAAIYREVLDRTQ